MGGPYGGGPTSPTDPNSRGPQSPGPAIVPLPEPELQMIKAQSNQELRAKLDEAFNTPEPVLRSYYDKEEFLDSIQEQFPGPKLSTEQLQRLAVAVAMINFFEIKQEFIAFNLQRNPMMLVENEAEAEV